MTSAFVAPLKPTWSRLLRLTGSGTSILRELEYEKLATLSFKGHTLDFGGGKKADYLPRLNIEGTLESLNISEKMEPTFIADANQTWPMEEARYDNILSMNTLEHIYRDIGDHPGTSLGSWRVIEKTDNCSNMMTAWSFSEIELSFCIICLSCDAEHPWTIPIANSLPCYATTPAPRSRPLPRHCGSRAAQ